MFLLLIVCLSLLTGVLLWAVVAFNHLVRLRNQVRTAWADIDVQLTRRHDLVPSLVSAVKAYAGHESTLLETATALRAQATATAAPSQLGTVESALGQALERLVVLKEAYPDLKASDNFAKLQRDLVDVEEQLQYARRFYNGAVRDFNDAIQRFPDLVVANTCGFDDAEFFQADEQQREAVKVEMPK